MTVQEGPRDLPGIRAYKIGHNEGYGQRHPTEAPQRDGNGTMRNTGGTNARLIGAVIALSLFASLTGLAGRRVANAVGHDGLGAQTQEVRQAQAG